MQSNSRRPVATPFNQQQMKAIQLQRHPALQVGFFFIVGLIFIPMGVYFINQSTLIVEKQYKYDGPDVSTNCSISYGNEGTSCSVRPPKTTKLFFFRHNFNRNDFVLIGYVHVH